LLKNSFFLKFRSTALKHSKQFTRKLEHIEDVVETNFLYSKFNNLLSALPFQRLKQMQEWRLLKLETADAYTNMAVDEAILKARIGGIVPNTLRLYQWKPSAVSIGRFQKLTDEIHVDNCKKDGVDIVRRITGGGAVYHDSEGELTYSITAKTADLGCKNLDMLTAYQKICSGLNEAVNILGTKAEYRPPDPKRCPNLTISGKKISGNAQTSKKGILLQHGTFMMDINHKKMFTYLKVPWAKTLNDVLKVSKRKLTSARQELDSNFSTEDACHALIKGFEKTLNVQFIESKLTEHEKSISEKYRKERFVTEEWTFLGKSSS
jgi:lipoate-protein ligase A